ncbi:hypothetical protein B0H13DRAFT_1903661 [Mycena leptocephala]|nr:hypothetical protein B0H13DRAFT_1903661 [Mycena leptocephala]
MLIVTTLGLRPHNNFPIAQSLGFFGTKTRMRKAIDKSLSELLKILVPCPKDGILERNYDGHTLIGPRQNVGGGLSSLAEWFHYCTDKHHGCRRHYTVISEPRADLATENTNVRNLLRAHDEVASKPKVPVALQHGSDSAPSSPTILRQRYRTTIPASRCRPSPILGRRKNTFLRLVGEAGVSGWNPIIKSSEEANLPKEGDEEPEVDLDTRGEEWIMDGQASSQRTLHTTVCRDIFRVGVNERIYAGVSRWLSLEKDVRRAREVGGKKGGIGGRTKFGAFRYEYELEATGGIVADLESHFGRKAAKARTAAMDRVREADALGDAQKGCVAVPDQFHPHTADSELAHTRRILSSAALPPANARGARRLRGNELVTIT